MIAWKSHRSPLRAHFSFQANIATLLLRKVQRAEARLRARARLRLVRCGNTSRPNVNLEIPSITAKGALQFPGKHGAFSVEDNTARGRARERARASARCTLRQ